MKTYSERTPLAVIVATVLLATATTADALTSVDTKCRAAIQKNVVKLATVALKAINRCIKDEIKAPTGANCNDLANPIIVAGGKVAAARGKLLAAVGGASTKCVLPDHAASLAEFGSICSSPGNDVSISGFADVGVCEADIAEGMVENVRGYILNPDAAAIAAHVNAKSVEKCGNGIAKTATKLWAAVAKTRGKCQNAEDQAAPADGDVDACATFDDGSIATAVAKLEDTVQEKCVDAGLTNDELFLLHSCAADAPTIKTCIAEAIKKNASGVNSTSYEFAGVCPTTVDVRLNARGPSDGTFGRKSKTSLDSGWNGLGHGADLNDGFAARVNLSCSDASCSSCAVTVSCDAGNCRCSNNQAIQCDDPFNPDTECGGNTCLVAFGPPLSVTAGGTPLCVVDVITSELVGTTDAGTGSSSVTLNRRPRVYNGVAQRSGCPTCSGATIGAVGTCSGGQNNGAACTTNAINRDFGGTSYQCQPSLGANITGAGLKVTSTLTDGAVSLPFGDACDPPNGALACACGACSGDNSQPCNGDADCAGLGLGTCEKGGSGVSRRPNNCNDNTCEDVGNELGQCASLSGEANVFCDGFKRKDGSGVLTCATNADCTALDTECPGGGLGACGTCTLSQPKQCFLDPIDVTGLAGSEGAELVSLYCWPPTNGTGRNAAYGWPGAARLTTDWDFDTYCPDGVTEWELGGSNCP